MPPHAIGKLLFAGRLRSGHHWYKLEAQLGLRKGTREFWINGHTKRLPLVPIALLAAALEITGDELLTACVHGTLPGWAERELAAWEEEKE